MAKYLPHGTTFSIGGDEVGGLISVSIPDRSRGEAETTDTESTYREFIAGMRDPGSVNLTFRHDPADTGQLALEANFEADGASALETCIITLPGGSRTYTFTGYVSQPPSGDLGLADDAAAEQTCTIRVAGAVDISP